MNDGSTARYEDDAVGTDDSGDRVRFSHYALAFYDLLAQQSSLEALRRLPKSESATGEFVRAAKATVGTVKEFRKVLRGFIESFARPSEIPAHATPEGIATYKRILGVPLCIQSFADTSLMYYAFPEGEPALGLRNLWGLVTGIGVTHLMLLASGVPGRGSIEVDIGCDALRGEVYGPVVSRAYRLESSVAGYPRVVVGEGFREFCLTMSKRSGPGFEAAFSREMAAALSRLTTVDQDGQTIVHFLGTEFLEFARQIEQVIPTGLDELVTRARAFALEKSDCFRNDAKLGPRYQQLLDYFTRYTPA